MIAVSVSLSSLDVEWMCFKVWPQVKAANPHLSAVTEIGAVVGAMWRELDPVEKQRYNDQFIKDKVG